MVTLKKVSRFMFTSTTTLIRRAEDEVDEPSLIPASQGAEFELLDTETPVQPTSRRAPPPTCTKLSRVVHPNVSLIRADLAGYNSLEQIRNLDRLAPERNASGNVFYPFRSRCDWQMGKWLTDTSLSHAQVNSFLKLDQVRNS